MKFTNIFEDNLFRNLIPAALLCFATTALAGQWHYAGSLRCGDCHIYHASESGQPLYEGPYAFILRKGSVNDLCLSCHDGSDPTTPDVVAPVDMYSNTVSNESGGGFMGSVGADNVNGHNLGLRGTVPLQGAGGAMELSCTSCHAVHGNDNYRNLVTDPANVGASLEIIEGISVFTEYAPADPPSPAATVAAYDRGNVAYVFGITEWCSSCHDLLAENSQATVPGHFNGHPSNVALNTYTGEMHTDPSHWVAGSGEGFAAGSNLSGISRVPYLSPYASSFAAARTPQATDQVTCLSCHKAHGSTYHAAMLWPYSEGGDQYVAGCQQCHNK